MRETVLKKVEFSGGYLVVLPPNKTRKSWLIEVWKRRTSGTHYRTEKRSRYSEQRALQTAMDLAQALSDATRREEPKHG